MREPAALIVGGGLAGAAAACRLGPAARLLEREAAPVHKVCGEFLSAGALAELAALGVDVAALGAQPIGRLRLVHRGRVAESTLPFPAAGLSRRVLDEALLARAAALGAEVLRGVRVRSYAQGVVQTQSGALAAPLLLLATGKHDLRGLPRPPRRAPERRIGYKLHLRLRPAQAAALAGHIELVLFAGGYAGLQMVEGGAANLCLLADPARHGADWPSVLAALTAAEPHLARRLEGAVPCWPRPLTIARVPYGYLARGGEPGVLRLGDQAAVIPSFCGDGMAIALHSARLAARSVQEGVAYHRALRRDAGPAVRLAAGVDWLTRSEAVRRVGVAAAQHWPWMMRSLAKYTRNRARSVQVESA